MTEKNHTIDMQVLSRWEQHKFMALIALTIGIALILVMVSLRLYSNSGAAQLDLSRPGYQSVREQASRTVDFDAFPASGSLNEEALSSFRTLYNERVKEATAVDSFGGDVMSDAALNLEIPTQQ